MSIHPLLQRHRKIKDPIFGLIAFTPLECAIIDTPEFQALRRCKQLGVVSLVYPSAVHSRFEHSLQVCYLSGELMHQLYINDDTARKVNSKIVQIVRLAGLLHDGGHMLLSHTSCKLLKCFPNLKPEMADHEKRGCLLIKYLWKMNKEKFDKACQLNDSDLQLLCDLIIGSPSDGNATAKEFPWLFEIVANKFNELDSDKICYIHFDSFMTGKLVYLEWQRIYSTARIMENHIVYSKDVASSIVEIFEKRHKLYNDVYFHKTVLLIEAQMLNEVLEPLFRLNNFVDLLNDYENNGHAWRLLLTDDALYDIRQRHYQPGLYASLTIEQENLLKQCIEGLNRLQTRELYKICDTSCDSVEEKVQLGYANTRTNPLEKVLCYSKTFQIIPLLQCNVSQVHLNNFQETKLLSYTRNNK